MKKQILISIVSGFAGLAIAANASAAVEGPYIGGALGWGDTHQSQDLSQDEINAINLKDTGIAGRVFAGMQLNPNWAIEAGFTKFSNSTGNGSFNNGFESGSSNLTVKTYAIDAVAKITLPLQDGFSLFGKVGAAYLNEAGTGNVTTTDVFGTVSSSVNQTEGKILPTFGLGAGYDINKNVTADVSWMRIQKVGNTDLLQNTDLVAVGVTYHIG